MTTWAAVNMPRIRDELLEAFDHRIVRTWLDDHARNVRHPAPGTGRINRAEVYPDDVKRWLAAAELFLVTEPMSELVSQAAAAMPPYRVRGSDLPAPAGLVVWARPVVEREIVSLDGPDQWAAQSHIRGALWATTMTKAGPGVFVVMFNDTDVLLSSPRYVEEAKGDPDVLRRMRSDLGPLALFDAAPLVFADAPDVQIANRPIASILTTWLLMGQRIAVTTSDHLPRQLRRQYQREGRPEPLVRSITLRRSSSTPRDPDETTDGEGRRYHHRWPVREYGYWRNTYYPSTGEHRPQFVFVPTYIKGPEGAPVIGGERVSVLRR